MRVAGRDEKAPAHGRHRAAFAIAPGAFATGIVPARTEVERDLELISLCRLAPRLGPEVRGIGAGVYTMVGDGMHPVFVAFVVHVRKRTPSTPQSTILQCATRGVPPDESIREARLIHGDSYVRRVTADRFVSGADGVCISDVSSQKDDGHDAAIAIKRVHLEEQPAREQGDRRCWRTKLQ